MQKLLKIYFFCNEHTKVFTTYDLETFPMRVQSLNRTLIDKVFAVCDYYLQGKDHRNAIHFYKEDYRETMLS